MNADASRFEVMALQSLMAVQMFAVEKALELLNQTRAGLALAPMVLQEGQPARRRGRPPAGERELEAVAEPVAEIHEAPVKAVRKKAAKKKMTPAQRRHVGEMTRARWEAVRE